MDPSLFLADLERIPTTLPAQAAQLRDERPWASLTDGVERVLLAGMGSSWFAAQIAALRLRRRGIAAVAELASTEASWPSARGTLTIAISASGGSAETLAFAEAYPDVVALTNDETSTITRSAAAVVPMLAGPEPGGVACRTYRHTLLALLALEEELTGTDLRLLERAGRAAAATGHLLDTRDAWLPEVLDRLDGPHGVYSLAPAERIGSALQSALMVREGPRRPADGCETGDWSHVDVYLTKTLDYRALVLTGSRYDAPASRWMIDRGTTAVAVGGAFDAATTTVRYEGDDDPLVAALTEVLVAELVAAAWWTDESAS
jgi:fructoselysine-6-P-deglycase FrlB-like protein